MEETLIQTNYAIDTFYFLVMGAMVMFMACGFAMLESGLVRAKNTSEILTKNVALYSISPPTSGPKEIRLPAYPCRK